MGYSVMESEMPTRENSLGEKKSPALRVLIVDDEPLIRWSLAETLGDQGHEVVESGDARGARSAVTGAGPQFDVVVLDLRLPDCEDLALLESIRRAAPGSQVILMTAFGTPEVVRGALDLGAYRVVSKPFEMRELANLVAEAAAAPKPH
jgi:DNA-binding NtrC family response regulator